MVLVASAASHLLGLLDALRKDWPGWDEGWALVVFPLGIPIALLAALQRLRPAVLGTLAVWAWGLVVFAAWSVFGA